jgi:hypothetical protein
VAEDPPIGHNSIFLLKRLPITIKIRFTATPMIRMIRLASVTRTEPVRRSGWKRRLGERQAERGERALEPPV